MASFMSLKQEPRGVSWNFEQENLFKLFQLLANQTKEGGEAMEEFLFAASNYGFPMVVAGYLLIRIEPTLKSLQKSITLLTFVIAKQSDIDIKQAQCIIESGTDSDFYK